MSIEQKYYNVQNQFEDTAFDQLMQKRIHRVLLICSSYDAFMLEEDGRIDEQIFNEYVSLSLRHPPQFIHVASAEEAFETLQTTKIDLVITMLSVGGMDPFSLSKKIKDSYSNIPIVVLTPFSREVSLYLSKEDTSAIDYVFCWLGNTDLLLAIIKLIEDNMNAPYDVPEIGVQTILLVEDSVRFYSSYLPLIYKILFKQSRKFMTEGLNAHQKMMRMRGRPKILLARTFEEAASIYKKYNKNMLGIISDVSFKHDGVKDSEAGVALAKLVKKENPYMPFLLQSSDQSITQTAKEVKVGFIHKHSKFLLQELKDFLNNYLAFGDFIFINPATGEEVNRVSDLRELQDKLLSIPNESLHYHFKRDHVSKWLTARALFSIADVVKDLKVNDDSDIDQIKNDLFHIIAHFRMYKGRGIIASFDSDRFDEYVNFARIGEGSLGGKARGLAFLSTLIKKYPVFKSFEDVLISIPRTVVLGVDIFEAFMENNNLYPIGLSEVPDEDILKEFVAAKLPAGVEKSLLKLAQVVRKPIAVRSSSILEDSHHQPFAGIYSTYMIAHNQDCEEMAKQIGDAIKCVYASVYFKSSKAYMASTLNLIDEERMGIVLQEIVGQEHENRFYPTFSGVARSVNFYPIPPEKSEEGIVNVALGLGKHIVDGGTSLRFSPKYPQKVIQLSSPDMTIRETQKTFYALDLDASTFSPVVDDGINIRKHDLSAALKDGSMRWIGSLLDMQNYVVRDGTMGEGYPLVTFANILKYDVFPLAQIVKEILETGQKEMNQPVEIEFAVDLQTPDDMPSVFYLLQIRPIVDSRTSLGPAITVEDSENTFLYSESALGNGTINEIRDIVYIKPEVFKPANNSAIASEIESINDLLQKSNRPYLLVGPGRWGSQDPWLGVPVKWPQICGARAIVEMGLENYHVEPSQGTHFFQNLTSLRVAYIYLNTHLGQGKMNLEWLNEQKAVKETSHIRHVRTSSPLVLNIDGKEGKAAMLYPK
ncbi:PEP/pyruvate-binding domain-containing protein [Alkalitalea saponilacus]|uniref:Response regulator receiver domain-containing protein n=1 Tax=Alkalitalea saponilacus TaxID=889453 RepID=A0A1T5BXV5_9BACT|nr:PEP/pyruvate-binding domain-containing protein [Alkalitalea saponilacus]ASB51131.1 phosphoenolpyruvate synthase [Alkalitalea saponilacus]SKB51979.1 Response regulator receiver domain-containing protein [Alkalitalea saponilacus]